MSVVMETELGDQWEMTGVGGSTLAGGTQEGFSGEGTLGQSQPWEDLGSSVSDGIRRACS